MYAHALALVFATALFGLFAPADAAAEPPPATGDAVATDAASGLVGTIVRSGWATVSALAESSWLARATTGGGNRGGANSPSSPAHLCPRYSHPTPAIVVGRVLELGHPSGPGRTLKVLRFFEGEPKSSHKLPELRVDTSVRPIEIDGL